MFCQRIDRSTCVERAFGVNYVSWIVMARSGTKVNVNQTKRLEMMGVRLEARDLVPYLRALPSWIEELLCEQQ